MQNGQAQPHSLKTHVYFHCRPNCPHAIRPCSRDVARAEKRSSGRETASACFQGGYVYGGLRQHLPAGVLSEPPPAQVCSRSSDHRHSDGSVNTSSKLNSNFSRARLLSHQVRARLPERTPIAGARVMTGGRFISLLTRAITATNAPWGQKPRSWICKLRSNLNFPGAIC